ncbi:autotransporter domain-containing protein [Ereboglobus luteus]|uniref:Autotransporter domain-containing protein n=1 Tax=Ereboglobus luteus TaxID=1796921 RepID=A0A2U8E0J1_9BACT|nr:autotransporter domain-containing protein [Ereboglobus luteus]AWI08358.1 hypothetical protein CKA38_02980 [Ereboglobus luteus]
MKHPVYTSPRTGIIFGALALVAATFPQALPAQAPEAAPVDGTFSFYQDTTYAGFGAPLRQAVNLDTSWLIADGVTVTVKDRFFTVNNSNHGGAFAIATNVEFIIAPLNKTGWVVFENNLNAGPGGVFNPGNGTLWDITNASFINNKSTTSTEGGGAMKGNSTAEIRLNNVIFDGNSGRSGGAITYYGNARITDSVFVNNIAHSSNTAGNFVRANANGTGGAIQAKGAKLTIIRESSFVGNRALWAGGAIAAHGNNTLELFDIKDISNNYASFGGAIADANNSTAKNVDGITFKYTGTTGITDFVYSGNVANGAYMTAKTDIAALLSGSIPFTPSAKGGGFYWTGTISANNANPRLAFDIVEGVTVSIGKAGNPSAWDSIATMDRVGTTGPGSTAKLELSGAGRLILHADNSYYQGSVSVQGGSLILGNQNASLGGAVTVNTGATLGGSGTLVTHKQDDSIASGRTSLTLASGARLSLGTDAATEAETLYVGGNVTATAGAIFNHDLFESGSASKLSVTGNLILTGTSADAVIVNLGLLANGSFTLMEWTGSGLSSSDLDLTGTNSKIRLTVDGVAESARSNASLSVVGKTLVVTSTVNNLIMKWTGANGNVWTRRTADVQRNWADADGSAENRFFNADSVLFDGDADSANPDNRIINIAAGGVVVSGMEVTGSARYEFRGEGGITSDAGAIGNASFTPTDKLKKSGSGELIFANTAANTFASGIDVEGGMITFDRAAQLGSGTGGILFSDSGTLRATETVSGTLAERLTVAAGKTAELMVNEGGSLVYDGTLAAGGAGAVLRKTGEGSVLLTNDNSANTVGIEIEAGSLTLGTPSSALGGNITVGTGASLGGAGSAGNYGQVKVASGGILEAGEGNVQSGTLTVHNLTASGGAIFKFDLFKTADGAYQESDRLHEAGTSSISGTNFIDITTFATGTFNLGDITDLVANSRVTLNGMALASGGRILATLENDGGILSLTMSADQSRVLAWTGGADATWNLTGTNWTDSGAVNNYSYGDRVIFDSSSDAGAPAHRTILIDASEVHVADMTVSGDADYTFTGGGIHASADNVQDDGMGGTLFSGSGKLTKAGDGILTFENGKNTFVNGVEIGGGVIAISNGNQLTTSDTAGITFTGDATLRATADLVIDDTVAIGAGKTGILDSNGHNMILSGSLVGGVNTTFVKDGAGTLLLDASLGGYSGTLAVRRGTLQAGAEETFSFGKPAAIVVDDGAILDLGGHNQSVVNLTGLGAVNLSDATLAYAVATGESIEFAGKFIGAGTVIKDGAGKLTLSGSSSMSGEFVFMAGEIGLASNAAFGSSLVRVGTNNGKIHLNVDDLTLPNDIEVEPGKTLTIESAGHNAELPGKIGGAGTLILEGTGTFTLAGNNSISRLDLNTPLTIARSGAIGVDVNVATGSTLEYRDIALGQVASNISGDRVLFTNSTLSLTGQNTLKNFVVGAGTRLTAISTEALGGLSADVVVRDGGWLKISNPSTLAHNVTVDGGTIVFGSDYLMGSLGLTGTMNFANGGEIRLGGALYTGIYTAAIAYGGIANMPTYDPNQGDMLMVVDIVDGYRLQITAYNKALQPGKDIVAGLDAMRASTNAVFSHINEDFILPLIERDRAVPKRSLWLRMAGSFAEHESNATFLGYKDNSSVGAVGFDWASSKNYMFGACIAYTNTRLETANGATTEMDAPVFGAYGAVRKGNFYTSGNASFSPGSADTERCEEHNNFVKGTYDFRSLGGGIEAGYVWPVFTKATLRPSIGLQYTNISFSDYSETGKGAVRMDDFSADSLHAQVRLGLSRSFLQKQGRAGMVDVSIGWRQELLNDATDVQATLIEYPAAKLRIRGDKYDENSLMARIGLRMMLSKTTLFAFSYEYEYIPFGDHKNATRRDTFMASIRQSW